MGKTIGLLFSLNILKNKTVKFSSIDMLLLLFTLYHIRCLRLVVAIWNPPFF